MRKALSVLFIILSMLPLSAAYSVVIPETADGNYLIMDSLGETLPLDDTLYYKEWSGLLAEQLNTGIYKIKENERSIIIVTKSYSMDLLRYALWSQMDISAIVVPVLPDIEPSELRDSKITQAVTLTEPSVQEKSSYYIHNIDIDTIEPGDVIEIVDGNALIEEKEIVVYCPHCGETFTVKIR